MDIGFETIIYIVLGLVFVLAQIAKKKKKEAQSQLAEDEDNAVDERPSSTSILEQMLGIPEIKQTVKKPVENNTSLQEDMSPSFHQPEQSVSAKSPVSEVVKSPVIKKGDYDRAYRKIKSGKSSVFNLRQAVIYKALLERKNY